MRLSIVLLLLRVVFGLAQYNPNPTPVPILKQINRHNEDGSYSYGYESADGSYKIESKYPNGEVFGKYGFVDDTGSIREVEYGASQRGFEPTGTGINVPPPATNGNSIAGSNEPEDDGQYREDPSIYYTDPRYTNGERYDPVPKQVYQYRQPQQMHQQKIADRPPLLRASAYQQPAAPVNQYSQSEYRPQYQRQYQPQYERVPQSIAQNKLVARRYDSPATPNADISLGSYSVQYKQ